MTGGTWTPGDRERRVTSGTLTPGDKETQVTGGIWTPGAGLMKPLRLTELDFLTSQMHFVACTSEEARASRKPALGDRHLEASTLTCS